MIEILVWRFCPLTSYKWPSLPPQYELGYFLMTRPKLAFNPQPVKIFVIPALSPAHWMLAGLIAALTTSLLRALNKYLSCILSWPPFNIPPFIMRERRQDFPLAMHGCIWHCNLIFFTCSCAVWIQSLVGSRWVGYILESWCELAIDFQRCAADSDWHRQLKSFSFDLNDYFSFFHCWIKTTQPKETHRIHYPWISFWDKLTVW